MVGGFFKEESVEANEDILLLFVIVTKTRLVFELQELLGLFCY